MERRKKRGPVKRLLLWAMVFLLAIPPVNARAEEIGDKITAEEAQTEEDTYEEGEKVQPEEEAPAEKHSVTVTTETLGEDVSVLTAEVEQEEFCAGTEVTVKVSYAGTQIWTAQVFAMGGETEIDFEMSADTVCFVMPDTDVEVYLSELEAQDRGDLSAEDSSIDGDWQGSSAVTEKEHEPDVELGKSARWTDIEDGYAELTITEKDTSDYSNLPVDYIIILDRTRTMSLSEATWETGGSSAIIKQNSPCINPNHSYQKGGITLRMLDYDTGYNPKDGTWADGMGGFRMWERHYNQQGEQAPPSYGNGCQDRLTMAKQAIYELVDKIETENAKVPAGKNKSRIAFWSFADGLREGNGDPYRERGLFNYTPWTENYDAVKAAVGEVRTFSGTYYTESLEEACRMITERDAGDGRHAGVYTKVIFISDGICGDGESNGSSKSRVRSLADKLKGLPNTELFTLAIGMNSTSEGARFLAELASGSAYTASFWQTLSFAGGEGSVFADTLFRIHEKGAEVKAVDKVLTDQIETKYWEAVEVLRADGGPASAALDKNTGRLVWKVPEGAGKTYSCTIKLKLKDAYRYLLEDASYPTNRDGEGAFTDPEKAGAVMSYTIDGGIYHTESRRTGIVTPSLKYGTVRLEGEKIWTVEGSRAGGITVRLMRTLPSQTEAVQINNALTNVTKDWGYVFDCRMLPDGTKKPLIKYDEKGRKVKYEVTERVPGFYTQLDSVVTEGGEKGENVLYTRLYNEPFKIKAQIRKADRETGNPLSGAEFTVYAWSVKAGEYLPYMGTTDTAAAPHETGSMTGAQKAMTLTEETKGIYITPYWLYYSGDNQGKYRIIETCAPEGYYGDWREDADVTEKSSAEQKNVYDFSISPKREENGSVITVGNQEGGSFGNRRVQGRIAFTKKDLESGNTAAQGEAALAGAEYRLYAAEDIVHQDGTTGILYQKDEEVGVSLEGAAGGVRTYRRDPGGKSPLLVGEGLTVVIRGLELGSYYLKEEKAGEGYLVSPKRYTFTLEWEGERIPEVEIPDYSVYEQVKKQSLSFYKVTGNDTADRLEPMEGAKFSVYLLSEFAGGKYRELSDEEAVQAVIDEFRSPETLNYEALRAHRPAVIYAKAEDGDVSAGRLTKRLAYADGTVHEADAKQEHAYLAAELTSDSRGVVKTPGLPYGRYLIAETTTPEGVTATRPFVVTVAADDEDGVTEGDGKGSVLDDLVILMDRPVMALVRIAKQDSESRNPVLKEGAAYVIHDMDGAWFDYYTKEWTTAQKNAYKKAYGDLVVQYSRGEYLGTKEQPFATRKVSAAEASANVYIDTPAPLPGGMYELEEISAPEGYVLQGHEGVIAKDSAVRTGNHTYYETQETGMWKATPQGRTRFLVSSGEAVYDNAAKAFVVMARQKNDPAVGKIAVYAEGEFLVSAKREGSTLLERLEDGLEAIRERIKVRLGMKGTAEKEEAKNCRDYVFTYEMRPVEGAQFEIRAAEDIYSPEGGGNGRKLFAEGELVVKLTTDVRGQTWTGQEDWEGTDTAKGLPLGKYTVTQTAVGEGFALSKENAEPREVEIAYAGQEVPVIYRNTFYAIPRQKVRIEIEKVDKDTGERLAGAVFGLYAGEDIRNYKGKTLVEAGTLLGTAAAVSDKEGRAHTAVFAMELPPAEYEVRELKAPEGYSPAPDSLKIDAFREESGEGPENGVGKETFRFENRKLPEEPEKEVPEEPSGSGGNPPPHSGKVGAPPTGDAAEPVFWFLLVSGTVVISAVILFFYRRKWKREVL